jgi:hypothetical protein
MTHDIAGPSVASLGSRGAVIVPGQILPGNFAGIKWNQCCRQHRDALNKAGIAWEADIAPEPDSLGGKRDGALTAEEREAIGYAAAIVRLSGKKADRIRSDVMAALLARFE